jgi:hypothetical protein
MLPTERRPRLESLTDTLMERLEKLVPAGEPPPGWGNPLLSTTPTSLAIRELALRTEALENAVREIALELRNLSSKK